MKNKMKVLILANNLKWKSWDDKIKSLKEWWGPEVELDITLQISSFKDIPWEFYKNSDDNFPEYGIKKDWFDKNISEMAAQKGFECVIFSLPVSQWESKSNVRGWHTHNNKGVYEIHLRARENHPYSYAGNKYSGGEWFNIARHELAHALYAKNKLTDNTHKWWTAGNLDQVKKEISEGVITNTIKSIISPAKQYKYFNYSEIEGLKPELVDMLDKAREIAGIPFVINSGYRTKEQNEKVGGKPNSAHLRGYAVDVRAKTKQEQGKIVRAAYLVGFRRVGKGKTFIHLDIDPSLPQDVLWDYESN